LPSAPATPTSDAYESEDTTHFSVIDEAGNIVSNTYTLNSFYGSQVMAKGTGVLMNDIMSGSAIKPAAVMRSSPVSDHSLR